MAPALGGALIMLDQRFKRRTDIKVRDLSEWHSAMVFDPERPGLCLLNPTAWIVLELCDGRTRGEIVESYGRLFGNRLGVAEAGQHVDQGIDALNQWGLITAVGQT